MLSFDDLGAGDWGKYGEMILRSENVFPEAIRTPEEDFLEVVSEADGVAKVALLDSQYVGNVFGYRMAQEDFEYYGISDVPREAKVIYLFSVVVNPEFQGRGYGHLLLQEFIKTAKAKGYDYVAGHFRQNNSLQLIRKFGARENGVCHNWDNTGEDCVVCCLDLHGISGVEFRDFVTAEKHVPIQADREKIQNPMPIIPDMDEILFRTEPHAGGPDLAVGSPHF